MRLTRKQLDKAYSEIPIPKRDRKELDSRFNAYACANCNHPTKTKDDDFGVTPMFHECEICGDLAVSMFYKAGPDNYTQVWYRPTFEEVVEMNKKQDPNLDHVLRGGLLNKKI